MKVLLSDGSHKNTLAIIRYLGREGHSVHILHHKKSAPAYSKYCKRLILCPPISNQEAYTGFLLQHVQDNKYDIFIPVGVLANKYSVSLYDKISPYVKLEVVHKSAFDIAINKRATFDFAAIHGIDHPRSFYPENRKQAEEMADSVMFPAVIKSSDESVLKFPTVYVDNRNDLCSSLDSLQTGFPDQLDRAYPLIQERIFGGAFGFFAVYQCGVCKKVFMHERIRENPVSGGVSTTARSFYDKHLLEAGKKVLDELKWHGPAMVEFKQDISSGAYKLIEINPKFWGSLELCLSAGMNFPHYLCMMARDEELEFSDNYHRKRRFIWLVAVQGELYRLFQKPRDFFPLVGDLLRFHSRSDFWWTDLKPTFIQLSYFVIWLKNRLFKKDQP